MDTFIITLTARTQETKKHIYIFLFLYSISGFVVEGENGKDLVKREIILREAKWSAYNEGPETPFRSGSLKPLNKA